VGLICLQGGNEFEPECATMDLLLLDRAGPGPVVVLPAAGAPGREYDTAGRNAVAYYTGLGAADVTVAPDPRDSAGDAAAAVRRAALLVIPGGSPRRLRDALALGGLADAVRAVAGPGVVTGSSAGAMVLCGWTVLPEPGPPRVAEGLGLVADFAVLAHYQPGHRLDWVAALRAQAPDLDVLGIPECSGVLLDGPDVIAVGAEPSVLLTPGGVEQLALQ
jgi:cyanophycinase-like exopeptidase